MIVFPLKLNILKDHLTQQATIRNVVGLKGKLAVVVVVKFRFVLASISAR